MIRSAGVLMPIFSLPQKGGIGTIGKSAERFVDLLAACGETYWQILPLGPTGYGNSPYQPLSLFAGNPYLIDPEKLMEDGYLDEEDIEELTEEEGRVDYGYLYNTRFKLLKKAADRLEVIRPEDYAEFIKNEKDWLRDYSLFMAIKTDRGGKSWTEWPDELRSRNKEALQEEELRLQKEVAFWTRIQYFFAKQMKELKKYANDRGIKLIGDLPFYAALDSIDVWAHPEMFDTKDNGMPSDVAGMPDQKWGNPLYDWNAMRNSRYEEWIKRAVYQYRYCDVLRLDHFRGYMEYYAVPVDGIPAEGSWRKGPGLELFVSLKGNEIIVEDLGWLTEDFLNMVKESGYPGMKILEYAFDPSDPGGYYMPFRMEKNAVIYTGTHDNETLMGWIKNPENSSRVERAKKYLGSKEIYEAMIGSVYGSVCDTAILPMQDLLKLDNTCRMNNPGSAQGNWEWRMSEKQMQKIDPDEIAETLRMYCRYNPNAGSKETV